MKNSFIAAGVALVASLGSVSASQADIVAFEVSTFGANGFSYTGASLDVATALNLGATSWPVYQTFTSNGSVGPDQSGLVSGDPVTLSDSNIPFTIGAPLILSWTGSSGLFTETMTLTDVIRRTSISNSPDIRELAFLFTGTMTGGGYNDITANLELVADTLSWNGGPTRFSVQLNNNAYDTVVSLPSYPTPPVAAVPEASTWVMMLAGFAGLGFVSYRRNKAATFAA